MTTSICVMTHILIMGDFNLKEIDGYGKALNTNELHQATVFLEVIRDLFLYQHVKKPTRFRGDDIATTLDLVFTNKKNMISKWNIYPEFDKNFAISAR